MKPTKVLLINASARKDGSISRMLANRVVEALRQQHSTTVKERDLIIGVPHISEDWLASDHDALALSETLITEIEWADVIVIGLPMYNFGVPASFKAWFDQVARAGRSFRYVDGWPQGLLKDKPVFAVITSDGVPIGSELDFASPWLRAALGLVGLSNTQIVAAGERLTKAGSVDLALAAIPATLRDAFAVSKKAA
jgi:FMN-dependent NADH-azoreductase